MDKFNVTKPVEYLNVSLYLPNPLFYITKIGLVENMLLVSQTHFCLNGKNKYYLSNDP